MIRALARELPDLAPGLGTLIERLWDLLKVVEANYYHPDFHGSFSIKEVLPVLVPEMGYDDLAIADGREASAAYQQALDCGDEEERRAEAEDPRHGCTFRRGRAGSRTSRIRVGGGAPIGTSCLSQIR